MKPYELPTLGYDHGALEPHLSARILDLHHGKHHRGYVDGVNLTLAKLAEVRESGDLSSIVGLEKTIWNVVNRSDVANRFDGARNLVSSAR